MSRAASVTIRPIRQADLDEVKKLGEDVGQALDPQWWDAFLKQERTSVLVALRKGKIVGVLAYRGRGAYGKKLYIEDLYVHSQEEGNKVERMLLERLQHGRAGHKPQRITFALDGDPDDVRWWFELLSAAGFDKPVMEWRAE